MTIEHTVTEGQTFRSIALAYGRPDWQAIYDLSENSELRESRPDPDVLSPGDVVRIDREGPALIPYRDGGIACRTGGEVAITAEPMKEFVVHVRDAQGEPFADRRYALRLRGRPESGGTTDADGTIRGRVPMSTTQVAVSVWLYDNDPEDTPSWQVTLELDQLDAVSSVRGVQARLQNLGLYRGPIDGQPRPALDAAVREFRSMEGLEETSEIDDDFREALLDTYGR